MLENIREQLWRLHAELPKNNLVMWTGGNVSARDPETGLVAIKPSGIRYEDLRPEHMVIVDLEGNTVEGQTQPFFGHGEPSLHLPPPARCGRHRAYALALRHRLRRAGPAASPAILTAMADEFGGPIPCGGFALIGGEEIGKVVVESIGSSAAVLLKNHGVFTIGKNAEAAVKAAVMVEDVAATIWLALQIGQPEPIPQEMVDKLHYRYTHVYGQR